MHAHRKNICFPSRGGGLVTFELFNNSRKRLRSFRLGIIVQALPTEQKAQEGGGRNWLDLGTQAFDGITMNACQQPTLTPFKAIRYARSAPQLRF